MSSFDFMNVCRLCLAKDHTTLQPIFEGEGEVRQISLKITSCLPVKVNREDKLPQKICDECLYKVELLYEFWNNTIQAEKQLLQWLSHVDTQGYAVTTILNQDIMKGEQSNENRLDGSVMQQVSGHQSSMNMGIDNMMSMIMPNSNQQQITSVPMGTSSGSVQNAQVIAGSSTQTTHDQILQSQTNAPTQHEEEETSEDEENSDDECDGDDGLSNSVKEEEEDLNKNMPTAYVDVSLQCDEAGPSGIRQQKLDIQEMAQAADVDPKTGNQWVNAWDDYKYRKVDVQVYSIRKGSRVAERTKPVLLLENCVQEQEPNEEEEENGEPDHIDQMLDDLYGVCPTCDKRFLDNVSLEKHVQRFHKRPYKCNLCSKSYKTPYLLKVHKKTHTEVYECTICGLKFQRRLGLQRHQIRSHSTEEEKYICDYCGKQFRLKSDIHVHISNAHSTNRHICDVCGRTVKYLKCHMRKHLQKCNMNKFSCHLCPKVFTSQTKLDNHLLMHKEVFQCQECGQQCNGLIEMSRHRRVHQNNSDKCKICGKTFSKMTLRTHILSHAGMRPYKCDICDANFTQRSSLMRHRRSHPGPLPPLASISITQLVQNILQNRINSK